MTGESRGSHTRHVSYRRSKARWHTWYLLLYIIHTPGLIFFLSIFKDDCIGTLLTSPVPFTHRSSPQFDCFTLSTLVVLPTLLLPRFRHSSIGFLPGELKICHLAWDVTDSKPHQFLVTIQKSCRRREKIFGPLTPLTTVMDVKVI